MRRATRKRQRQSLLLLSCAVLGLAPRVVVGAPTKITDLTPAGIPTGVAFNAANNRVYATSSTQGTVTVINGGDNSVKTTILVGNGSNNNSVRGVAVNETTNLIYAVGLIGSGSLRSAFAVIDGATDTLSNKVELISTTSTTAPNPSRVAVDALSNRIYIQQVILAEGVAVYDGADNRLIGSVAVPAMSNDVAVNPAPGVRRFYVTGTNGGALNRLSVFSDLPDNLQFAVANVTVNEGAGSATISVVRVGTPSGAVSVNYATSDGSAMAPFDYTSTSGTLSFADGVTAQSITVPITFNATAEGDESFSLTLTAPRNNGASLGAPST